MPEEFNSVCEMYNELDLVFKVSSEGYFSISDLLRVRV